MQIITGLKPSPIDLLVGFIVFAYKRPMELRQLKYFKAVAEELHFQRAARKVHITQPSLSHQIKLLEEELGVTLLIRDRRSVALSEAGEVFLAHCQQILAQLDRAVEETKHVAGQEKLTLKLGTRFFINLPIFGSSVMATRRANPNISIEQIDMPTNEVADAVKEGTIDIGFAPAGIKHPALIVKKIVDGHFVVVMPKTHQLAQKSEIPISKLKGKPLIFFDRALNPKLYQRCVRYFEDAGFSPNILMETSQVQTGIRMASEGAGFFFLANYVVDELPDHLVAKRLSGFNNKISMVAVWHENNKSKALETYLVELRKLLAA